ncbi:hypothetical protein GO755_20835 [Spirosoma sp. HMF4905]|uniref:Uncharacterized protein n=1 Tax=Spirosoma arboris TaxID=2682092 RepID=A0A7K1SFA0_9BACT|nr:hypothetical protein [Spirosoma arboris]MVM32500.1 hypothetical protein [Spirosoma arboris]
MKLLFFVVGLNLALTPTPAHSQTAVRVANDSTRIQSVPPQQYDFYYSAQQADEFLKISIASYVWADRLKKNRFRDKAFTEVVAKGLPVRGSFDDYILIGSGTLNEIKPDGDW